MPSQRDGVVVTRPEPGLSEAVRAVEQQGWRSVASPMLNIQRLGPLPVEPARALLVTSGQALPALLAWPRAQRIIAVGEKTAERARDMGFQEVDAAHGDAHALERYCRTERMMGADVLLVTGRGYGIDFARSLNVQRREVYDVQPVRALSECALQGLYEERVAAVLFYSGRTLDAFCAAVPEALKARLKTVRAVCLSSAIAERVSAGAWRSVEYGDPLALLGEGPASGGCPPEGES